ncbi:MAG: ATP-binding cassette domain-containing protein [Candidatus Cloacimonetes bacterium]|nr:ATP-binding cassette domain-containing protein [Candidatus Cloacimonadota bacterium]
MIDVKDLNLTLNGKDILQGISFHLEAKTPLAILGKSGSGKTVLIKTILGLFVPDRGSISIDGVNMLVDSAEADQIRKRCAMVFQNAALLDSYTVYQNVSLPLYERHANEESFIRSKSMEALALVGLESVAEQLPAELSGGMRKRVGIARALVYDPEYIIFDEPVSGLDPITRQEIMRYIIGIINLHNRTVITITHDIGELGSICERVIYISAGRMIFNGMYSELEHQDNEEIRNFLRNA